MKLSFPRLLVHAFAIVLVPWGLSGMFFPRAWLVWLFHVDLDAMPQAVRATFLSEFRFLQARELGEGLLAWCFVDAITTDRRAARLFAIVVAAAPVARLAGLLADGMPAFPTPMFLAVEATMATVVGITMSRVR